jgi:cell division septation protein DedD
MLATCPDPRFRDGNKAVALAQRVVDRFPEANFMDTLAAAYAAAGNMEAAVRVQRLAVERLRREVGVSDRDAFTRRLNRYGQSVEAHAKKVETTAQPIAAVDGAHESSAANGDVLPVSPSPAAATGPVDTTRHADTDTFYTVHISSLRNRQWADETAARLDGKPYRTLVRQCLIEGDPIPWFRVYVGVFESRQAARLGAVEMKRQGQTWTQVVKLPVQE